MQWHKWILSEYKLTSGFLSLAILRKKVGVFLIWEWGTKHDQGGVAEEFWKSRVKLRGTMDWPVRNAGVLRKEYCIQVGTLRTGTRRGFEDVGARLAGGLSISRLLAL